MQEASLILSIISLIMSIAAICWLIGKQLSTHSVQMVPIDPFKNNPMFSESGETGQMGTKFAEQFRDFETATSDEIAGMAKRKLV